MAAAGELHNFHDRLTHSLKVAQVARRVAEHIRATHPEEADERGGLDPDVVEAAALAHDLGHPPFGHIGEKTLDGLLEREKHLNGFEGNPQSFRIVTKLALRSEKHLGLDLTRATLNAILKYPWKREVGHSKKEEKWGAYETEQEDFDFARAGVKGLDHRSIEAEVMDWADDVTYAVHDLEDFYRVGMIPLDRVSGSESESEAFVSWVEKRWKGKVDKPSLSNVELATVLDRVLELVRGVYYSLLQPFRGTRQQRAHLRSLTSDLISTHVQEAVVFVPAKEPNASGLQIVPELYNEVQLLKELTWFYVIEDPALATQQVGQRRILENLFGELLKSAEGDCLLLPRRYRDLLDSGPDGTETSQSRWQLRVVSDFISGLSEQQTLLLHGRLTANSFGSIVDLFNW